MSESQRLAAQVARQVSQRRNQRGSGKGGTPRVIKNPQPTNPFLQGSKPKNVAE